MKHTLNIIPGKWKWNGIVTIGGILIGAGLADCLFAINQLDLNQIARGLTIFSAGLTILVVIDNSKTQKVTEKIQKETQLRLEKVEDKLNAIHLEKVEDKLTAIHQFQQTTEKQLHEIKELLHKPNS